MLVTWVEISKNALIHNVAQYKFLLGNDTVLGCVIKSNAYGHGISTVAQLLDSNPDVGCLCTVSLSEALLLRSEGIQKPIVVLSIIDDDPEQVIGKNIALIVYDLGFAYTLNELGRKYKVRIPVHAKIDTGLSRTGVLYMHAHSFIDELVRLPYIYVEGIFSHFANVEAADQTFSQLQRTRFDQLINDLMQHGIYIPYRHISCSAAISLTKDYHYTFARTGIGVYGLWPSLESKRFTQVRYPHFNLKPVLQWKTRIMQLKTVPEGSYVGYDLTYKTTRQTTIAVLPVGYWDGYDRALSNNSIVIVNGRQAPVLGRIAMNLMMIDCTDIPNPHVGTEVLLLGSQDGVTADDMAQRIGTINYEIVTRINPLTPRIIVP